MTATRSLPYHWESFAEALLLYCFDLPMPHNPFSNGSRRPDWRKYQSDSRKQARGRRFRLRFSVVAAVLLLSSLVAGGLMQGWLGGEDASPRSAASGSSLHKPFSRGDLRGMLERGIPGDLTQRDIDLSVDGEVLRVETTIDVDLQSFLLARLDRKNSRQIGIVVMEGDTGRVLALVGFDKKDPERNPCLTSEFPAASIFKMVTAASAVDRYGFSAASPMQFNGAKHTLYKRQLTDVVDRYTTTVSLSEAFADSVNPVFGKLGKLSLGKPLLEKSAEAFGFNEAIDSELPIPPSRFHVSDEPYHLAEIASGFNRETTLSPVHGAMIASAVLNGGSMVTPSMIDRVVDPRGQLLYRSQTERQQRAMSVEAAAALGEMMEATVTSGTARRAFRNRLKDKVLSRVQIGGKTGSIGSSCRELRYDWFVGYAREHQGSGQVVVGVLVAHEEFIGTRAAEYARMALSHYFKTLFEKTPLAQDLGGQSEPSS